MTQLLGASRNDTLREIESMVADGWQGRDAQFRVKVLAQLGIPRGFRNPMGMGWPEARNAIRRAIHSATARDLARVLHMCFVDNDPALLARCYRRVGIGSSGDSDDQVLAHKTPPPTCEQYATGWASLDENERARFVLFVATLADAGIEEWQGAARQAMETVVLPAIAPAPAVASPPAGDGIAEQTQAAVEEGSADKAEVDVETGEEETAAAAPLRRAPVRLTPLDQAIIDLVVQSVAGQHGALPPQVVGGITEELVRLNSKRVQSRFHVGYLAALTGGAFPARRPDDNEERRAWLTAGWLMGHHRLDPHTTLDRFADLPVQDREAFLKIRDASEGIADVTVAHLAANDDLSGKLVEWIGRAGPDGITRAVGLVETLHRQDRAAEALAICRQVLTASGHYRHIAGFGPVMQRAVVLLAKSNRMLGHFREAEQIFEAIDIPHRDGEPDVAEQVIAAEGTAPGSQEPSKTIRYMIGLERLLCALHVSHSWDVWIPADRADRAVLDRLNGCADLMQRCLVEAKGAPLLGVAYLYGLWCILRGDAGAPEDFPDPCAVIRNSLTVHMDPVGADTVSPLRARLKVLDALLSVDDGGARTANAIESIVEYESVHGTLPFHAVKTAIEAALVDSAEAAWRLVLPRLGRDFAQFSANGMLPLCLQNGQVVQELVSSREDLGKQLDGNQRVLMMAELFKAAADQNVSRDVLADLADELIMRVSEFTAAAPLALGALCEGNRWSKVWDQEDFTAVHAGIASWCPEHVRVPVRAELLQRAHALAMQDPDAALELLDYCEILGELHDATRGTRALVKRFERQQAEASQAVSGGATRRVRVLFVGGDERQQSQQKAIIDRVLKDRPNTEVRFIHPGWSPNWGHALERAKVAVDDADIVVMLRFMRTLYGEGLRKAINAKGKQWRPVYGHASPSIARAIVQAANDLPGQG